MGQLDTLGRRNLGRAALGPARARAAYVVWLATPQSHRARELKDLTSFCQVFGVSIPDLAGYANEPGFMDAVVADTTHWRSETHAVIAAIKRNAEDPQRLDQGTWCVAYLEIVAHPAAGNLASVFAKPAK